MKVVCTIEARMTSTRLPGKVLLEVDGKPMLFYLVSRLKTISLVDEIVLATTVNGTDDVLEQFAQDSGISVYRGSERDVLGRVVEAASSTKADVVVRLTGDNPLCDPEIVEHMISTFLSNEVDYVGNAQVRSYPDGMEVEVISASALLRSSQSTSEERYREHACLYIRDNPSEYSMIDVLSPASTHWPELSLTLDEPMDYELISRVINIFGKERSLFGCVEIVKLLRKRPDLVALNAGVNRTIVE